MLGGDRLRTGGNGDVGGRVQEESRKDLSIDFSKEKERGDESFTWQSKRRKNQSTHFFQEKRVGARRGLAVMGL